MSNESRNRISRRRLMIAGAAATALVATAAVPAPMPQMQPMATFRPDRQGIVYDELNETFFRWDPAWAGHYDRYADLKFDESRGIVEWDGDLLAGWFPIEDAAALGFRARVDRIDAVP